MKVGLGYCILSCGCVLFHPTAEAAFVVHGQITGRPEDDRCAIELFRDGDTTPLRTIDMSDNIDRTVPVAPGRASYYVQIKCQPSGFTFKSQSIAVAGASLQRLDLGTIDVSRRQRTSR